MDTLLTKRNAILIVVFLSLWKIYLAATLQLHPDESYYWLWSRYLGPGYYDHAPLIAYFIRLTTLFSQQELWVRFSGILETVVVSVLAWVLSVQLFGDKKIASASVITLNVLPLTLCGSVLITPDVPVFLFISAGIYLYWQLVATQKAYYWYLVGIAFGLALLSKYTAVLLAPSLLLFKLATDERRWLRTIHPYAAFLLGCLFFLPVVYWNSQHQWVSFAFQMRHGLQGDAYSLGKVLVFMGGQMLVAGPLIWPAGAFASVRALFQKNKQMLFLSLTSLPTLFFFAYSSLKRTAAANWPCCAYFTFSILVSAYLLDGSKAKKRYWALAVLLSALLSVTAGLHARFGILHLEKISQKAAEADTTLWFYGWKEIAEELEKDPTTKIAVVETNQLASEITYYTKERIYGYVDFRHFGAAQYEFWALPESLRGQSGACVHYVQGFTAPPCDEYFENVGKTSAISVTRNGIPVRTYQIVRGTGYTYLPAPH